MDFILGADFAMALMLIALIRRRENGLPADAWLILALIALAAIAAGLAINSRLDPPPYAWRPFAVLVSGPAFLVAPTAIYLYIRSATGRFRRADLLWFAPAGLMWLWLGGNALAAERVEMLHGFVFQAEAAPSLGRAFTPLAVLASLAFPWLGLRTLARHRAALRDQLSDLSGVDLSWTLAVLWSQAVGVVLGGAIIALAAFDAGLGYGQAFGLILLLIGLQLAAAGWFGLGQPAPPPPLPASTTPNAAAQADFEALIRLMDETQLHREAELRLDQLAERAGRSAPQVSAALKAGGTNFFDFVNARRVAEAQAMLQDRALARVSILNIALDAGFASKASFNRIFRARTGLTPSACRAAALS